MSSTFFTPSDEAPPLTRKRPKQDFERSFCQVCESSKIEGSRALKVCAFCGLQLCVKHFNMIMNTNCEGAKYEYLVTHYSHEWWDADKYFDDDNPPVFPDHYLEILGVLDNKVHVMSVGHHRPKLPDGNKFSSGIEL